MNRSTYLEDQHVRDFIGWATHLATGEQELAWLDSRMRRFTSRVPVQGVRKLLLAQTNGAVGEL